MDIRPPRKSLSSAPSKPAKTLMKKQVTSPSKTLQQKKRRRTRAVIKQAFVRYGILTGNLLIVIFAVFMVLNNRDSNAATYNTSVNSELSASPLDRVSASDIAVNVARMTDLPEKSAVTNFADTINAEMETFSVSRDVAFAPQIMSANIKTLADIREYTTVEGDTVGLLAQRFGITSDSIMWSNDLTNNVLPVGIKILIPPMNGIIYTVRSGDTADRIANTFRLPASLVVSFNDTEVSGLRPGMRIFLPNATNPTPRFSFLARYGNNGYDFGYCTYYAAAKTGAPGGWGHAKTWAENAARTPGWYVDKIPTIGSIAQTPTLSYWGHVAVVEQVKFENGQYWIKTSDMNNLAGWNRVGFDSDWQPSDAIYHAYIHKL